MSLEFSQELDTAPIISPTYAPQDAGEIGLRPKLLSDYTGQEKAKGNLSIYIEAARRRNAKEGSIASTVTDLQTVSCRKKSKSTEKFIHLQFSLLKF